MFVLFNFVLFSLAVTSSARYRTDNKLLCCETTDGVQLCHYKKTVFFSSTILSLSNKKDGMVLSNITCW